jgi:chromosome segregation ATPase
MTGEGSEEGVAPGVGASRRETSTGTSDRHAAKVAEGLDELSLEQALKDVDLANARVMDLTQRLIAAQRHTRELQMTLDRVQVELSELRAMHDEMRNSRAFRTADRYWRVLGAFRQ